MARLGPSGLAQLFREIANYVSTRLSNYNTKAELDSLLDTKADDNNVIHTSGDETISGNKVFRNTIFRESDITTIFGDIVYRFEDSNNSPCGYIQNNAHYWQNNLHNRHLVHNNTSGKEIYLDIISRNNGTGIINIGGDVTDIENVTTVTSSTDYSSIATMGWVNNPATSTNVVHRTGNETISGTKYFNNDLYTYGNMFIKNNAIDLTVTPSTTNFNQYLFRDKNDVTTAYLQFAQQSDGNVLGTYVKDKSGNLYGVRVNTLKQFLPFGDNTYSLGSSSMRWGNAHITYTYTNRVTTYSITHPTDNSYFFISGGTDFDKGATLYLGGTSAENFTPGRFALAARKTDGSSVELTGSPDGTLKWGGKNIAIDENLVHTTGNETIAGNKTFSNRVSFPSGYYLTTDSNDNSLRIIRDGTNHGNNYKIIIQGDTGKIFAPNGFTGNLQGNADTATKASCLDNYSSPGGNKIYLDWDHQVKGYVGLKVDNTTMGGLITTKDIGSQGYVTLTSLAGGNSAGSLNHSVGSLILARCGSLALANTKSYANVAGQQLYPCRTEIYTTYNATGYHFEPVVVRYSSDGSIGSGTWRYLGGSNAPVNYAAGEVFGMFLRVA